MAGGSRLYFPTSGAPSVSPSYSAAWNQTTSVTRRRLSHIPTNSGIAQYLISETSATNPFSVLACQHVSDALPFDKAISGTLESTAFVRSASKNLGGTDARFRVIVTVIKPDNTVRGVLFDGEATGFTYPFYRNSVISGSLTPVNALAGDRIVVERGVKFVNTLTSDMSAGILSTDNYVYPDMSNVHWTEEGASWSSRDWIEFSQPDVWGPPKPTLGGTEAMVVEKPSRIPTRLGGMDAVVVEKPSRIPTRLGGMDAVVAQKPPRTMMNLAGMMVNALVPRGGQSVLGVYAAGFPLTEPRIKLPDGRWVPFRPQKADRITPPSYIGTTTNSFYYTGGRTIALTTTPKPENLIVVITTSRDSSPKKLAGLPGGTVPGVTWWEGYRSLDDRHVVWFGSGATGSGTVVINGISGFGSDDGRATAVHILKNTKPNIGFVQTKRELALAPLVFSPDAETDQIAFVTAVGTSSPTITKGDISWYTIYSNTVASVVRQNPLYVASPTAPTTLTVTPVANGVTGNLVVIGGDKPYVPPPDPAPIVGTTRYYMTGGSASGPFKLPWSSNWASVPSADNYYYGLAPEPAVAASGNFTVTKQSGYSVGGAQLSFPPLTAGVIAGSFRMVWPVDYIGTAYMVAILRLVSNDGSVVRGELANLTDSVNAASGIGNFTTKTLEGPLNPLVAQRGDRIVVELGMYFVSGGGGSAGYGGVNAVNTSDYPYQDNVVHNGATRGWFELIAN